MSMTTYELIDYINEHPEGYLQPDKSGHGWNCPCCSSGQGAHGTGMTENPRSPGHFTCHANGSGHCPDNSDMLDVIAKGNGIPLGDFKAKINAAAAVYGIEVDWKKSYQMLRERNGGRTTSRAPRPERPRKKPVQGRKQSLPEKQKRDYRVYYGECAARMPECDYLKKRGISHATAARFGIGYDPGWISPTAAAAGKKAYPSPRLIIPTSAHTYLARDVREDLPEKQAKYAKMKEGEVRIFNAAALAGPEPVFVVEGEIDAMSVAEMGKAALSIGGAGNDRMLLQAVSELTDPPPLILALDNDKYGESCRDRLLEGLKELGVYVAAFNISGEYKDPNEALVSSCDQFASRLDEAISMLPAELVKSSSRPEPSLPYEPPTPKEEQQIKKEMAAMKAPRPGKAPDKPAEKPDGYDPKIAAREAARAQAEMHVPPPGERYGYFLSPPDYTETAVSLLESDEIFCPVMTAPGARQGQDMLVVRLDMAEMSARAAFDLDSKGAAFDVFGDGCQVLGETDERKIREQYPRELARLDQDCGYGMIQDPVKRGRGRHVSPQAIDHVVVPPTFAPEGRYTVEITDRMTGEKRENTFCELMQARQLAGELLGPGSAAVNSRVRILDGNGLVAFRKDLDEPKNNTVIARDESVKEEKAPAAPQWARDIPAQDAQEQPEDAFQAAAKFNGLVREAAGEAAEPDALMDFLAFKGRHRELQAKNALAVWKTDPAAGEMHTPEGWKGRGFDVNEQARMVRLLISEQDNSLQMGYACDSRYVTPAEGRDQIRPLEPRDLDELLRAAGGRPHTIEGDHMQAAPDILYRKVLESVEESLRGKNTADRTETTFRAAAATFMVAAAYGVDMQQESARPFVDYIRNPEVVAYCAKSESRWMNNLIGAAQVADAAGVKINSTIKRIRQSPERAPAKAKTAPQKTLTEEKQEIKRGEER